MIKFKLNFLKKYAVSIALITQFCFFSLVANADFVDLPIIEARPQMINLNMQFKSKNKITKSYLAMPFYQTAEIENVFDEKNNVFIEVNPRYGKNNNEVSIEMKFSRTANSKAFAVKEIMAKIGEESKVKVKGMTIKVTPIL